METYMDRLLPNWRETSRYIFVYTPPKVGSTTLVTSLRISLGIKYGILHFHDETMIEVLGHVSGVTINEIIAFLAGREGYKVYVIDVYRTPIERKMSEYFEKLSPYHFNNTEEEISRYSMSRIIRRFNQLFPHLENGDHYFEKYALPEVVPFNTMLRHSVQKHAGVMYVKLRLCDASTHWARILSSLLQEDIVLIKDYQTETKGIGKLYKQFQTEYRLPANYSTWIEGDKYLKFYYSEEERSNYLAEWKRKSSVQVETPYTEAEYVFYMKLCLENQHISDIQATHYIDNGCYCPGCCALRRQIYQKAKRGERITDPMVHTSSRSHLPVKPNKFVRNQFKLLHR